MTTRPWATRLSLALVIAFATVTTAATATTSADVIELAVGETKFWTGAHITEAGLASDDGSGNFTTNPGVGHISTKYCASDPRPVLNPTSAVCTEYEIDVASGGSALRVAVDHPSNFDSFGIVLVDPTGRVAAEDTGEALSVAPGQNLYSAEVVVDSPAGGRWRATVVANDVRQSGFRMRARLEPTAQPAASTSSSPSATPLLPNLRIVPPFQIGLAPCLDNERSAYEAQRCLRFSEGPTNVGEGPLDLVVESVGEPGKDANGEDSLVGTQLQRIHHSDGAITTVEAGRFEYHLAHAHYHHSQTGNFELLRVAHRNRGGLTPAGTGPKQGFCMGDYLIVEWQKVANAPRRTDLDYLGRPNCGVPTPGRTQMGISAGWGDVYPRGVEGQYVEFGSNSDGFYVIRAAVNPDESIVESRYDDNVGYAFLRVCGTDVDVIERGLGTDPWDRDKVVVDDHRQPTMDTPKTEPPAPLPDPTPCPRT